MRQMVLSLFAAAAMSGVAALEPTCDDFWDTRNYVTVEPNTCAVVAAVLDAQPATCGIAAAESFDSQTWTLHLSNVLRIFRSTPPTGFLMSIH